MAFNPFRDADGSSFESGNPLVTGPKKAAQAVSGAVTQQAKAAKQSFVDQLYGNVTPSNDSGADDAGMQDLQKQATGMGATPNPQAHVPPAEQNKLDETRKKLQELQEQHKTSYVEKTFGEEAQKKRQQREEEEREMKMQEEEAAREQEEAKKQQMEEAMQALQPAGKGRNRMSQPISVTQAKTKTESNRGTSG